MNCNFTGYLLIQCVSSHSFGQICTLHILAQDCKIVNMTSFSHTSNTCLSLKAKGPNCCKVIYISSLHSRTLRSFFLANSNCRTGKIPVNDEEQTNVPYIYAVGDILQDKLELTPLAIQTGRLLVQRLYAGATSKVRNQLPQNTVIALLLSAECKSACLWKTQ